MRIWDIDPGYLNRQSLLGEHRELHGLLSIMINGKKGYSKHPETLRWLQYGWGLTMRHQQLVCEMNLRGYNYRSPAALNTREGLWPELYIDQPGQQFNLLAAKYSDKPQGRIPLPKNSQQLWSQHKYSVLARNPMLYKQIGRDVASASINFNHLAEQLTETLRVAPTEGKLRNAIQHMWGYVSDRSRENQAFTTEWSLEKLLLETQKRALSDDVQYLMQSTALSELMVWILNTQAQKKDLTT